MAERIQCDVEKTPVEDGKGRARPGVKVTCSLCGDTAECVGRGAAALKECLRELRENCELGEYVYVVKKREEDDDEE